MGCRVMDPLKCTTIAVKSKNVSAFVFIVVVVVVVGVKSCCGLSINNTLCQGVSFFTVEKKRAGNRLISSAHSWTGANVRQVAAVLPGSYPGGGGYKIRAAIKSNGPHAALSISS